MAAPALTPAEKAVAPDPGETGMLTLMQWLSPAFPLGSFAWSHGLEWAIARGIIHDAGSLHGWLADVVEYGSGRNDAILLALALAEGANHAALTGWAKALAPARERLAETLAQGTAFTATTNALTGRACPPAPLPVALGRAAAGLGVAPVRVVALYLHSFVSALVQAGVRFLPLGQTEGQQVLARLHAPIARVAARAVTAGLDDLASAGFGSDMAAMQHETMDVRLFKS